MKTFQSLCVGAIAAAGLVFVPAAVARDSHHGGITAAITPATTAVLTHRITVAIIIPITATTTGTITTRC